MPFIRSSCGGEISCYVDFCITDYCVFETCEYAYSWFGLPEDFDWHGEGTPPDPDVCADIVDTYYCPEEAAQ